MLLGPPGRPIEADATILIRRCSLPIVAATGERFRGRLITTVTIVRIIEW